MSEATLRRISVRGLMAAIAVSALILGGALECARLRRLGREYSARAIRARRLSAFARISVGWSRERWLSECRRLDESERGSGGMLKLGRPPDPERAARLVAYWDPIIARYDRAAQYPWLPVGPEPPVPE